MDINFRKLRYGEEIDCVHNHDLNLDYGLDTGMDNSTLEIQYGFPLQGRARDRLYRFLERHGLEYEGGVDFTVNLLEEGEIVATASLAEGTIRYVAVSWAHQSRGLAATVLSEVINHAATRGRHHLFLFTHPRHQHVFSSLGFYPVAKTDKALVMENRRNGMDEYIASLAKPAGARVGCIVAECNPFTNGHLHLVEHAAAETDALHLFVLPSGYGELPVEVRGDVARQATSHISNVIVQPSGPYLIPPYNFPDYFIEEKDHTDEINCALELTMFARRIAKPLGITRRYVGEEPFSSTSAAYNREMQRLLPTHGIEVIELPRLAHRDKPVSGGRVRRLLREGKHERLRELVPASTFAFLTRAGPMPVHN